MNEDQSHYVTDASSEPVPLSQDQQPQDQPPVDASNSISHYSAFDKSLKDEWIRRLLQDDCMPSFGSLATLKQPFDPSSDIVCFHTCPLGTLVKVLIDQGHDISTVLVKDYTSNIPSIAVAFAYQNQIFDSYLPDDLSAIINLPLFHQKQLCQLYDVYPPAVATQNPTLAAARYIQSNL